MQAVIKIEALGHVLVLDELTRENDIDRDAEKWSVEFDGQCVAKMYLHPDHGWPKIVTPLGRDKVQEVRTWIWSIARAHKVNAENILEVKGPRGMGAAGACWQRPHWRFVFADSQLPPSCVTRLAHNNYQDADMHAAHYFRYALRHAWEL